MFLPRGIIPCTTLMIKLYLCSQSPRRRELLGRIHSNFNSLSLLGEEPRFSPKETPEAYLKRCLEAKFQGALESLSRLKNLEKSCLFLVADTIVVRENKVIGKPENRIEAKKILKSLSGKKHQVKTGYIVAQMNSDKVQNRKLNIVSSYVRFYHLSDTEIKNYVASGDADDKAGAYGFQAGALRFVSRVEGSYTNIMGLPLLPIKKDISDMVK